MGVFTMSFVTLRRIIQIRWIQIWVQHRCSPHTQKAICTFQDPPAAMSHSVGDYHFGQEIGSGGFGKVFRAKSCITNQNMAIKVLNKRKIRDENLTSKVESEISIHRELRHENIVELLGCMEDDENIYLLLELCPLGNLFVNSKKYGPLPESDAVQILKQVLIALEYIHSKGIIHRDLKLSNILLTADVRSGHIPAGAIKLCDFGLATKKEHPDEDNLTMCGTPNYMPPEVASSQSQNYSVDVWAAGCLFYTLVVGRAPFESGDFHHTVARARDAPHEIPPGLLSEAGEELLNAMLQKDPRKRPSVRQLLQHTLLTTEAQSDLPLNRRTTSSVNNLGRTAMGTNRPLQPIAEAGEQLAGACDAEGSLLDDSAASQPPLQGSPRRQLFRESTDEARSHEQQPASAQNKTGLTQQQLLAKYEQLMQEQDRLPAPAVVPGPGPGPGSNASFLTTSTELVTYPQQYGMHMHPHHLQRQQHPAQARISARQPTSSRSEPPPQPLRPERAAPLSVVAAPSSPAITGSEPLLGPQPSPSEPTPQQARHSADRSGPGRDRSPVSAQREGPGSSLIASNEDFRLLLLSSREDCLSGSDCQSGYTGHCVGAGAAVGVGVRARHSSQYQKPVAAAAFSFLSGLPADCTEPHRPSPQGGSSDRLQHHKHRHRHQPQTPVNLQQQPHQRQQAPFTRFADWSTQYAYDRFIGGPAPIMASPDAAHAVPSTSASASASGRRGQATAPSAIRGEEQPVRDSLAQVLRDLAQLPPRCALTTAGELLVVSASTDPAQRELVLVTPLAPRQPHSDSVSPYAHVGGSPASISAGAGSKTSSPATAGATKYVRLILSTAAPQAMVLGQVTGKARGEYESLVVDVRIGNSATGAASAPAGTAAVSVADLFQEDLRRASYVYDSNSGAEEGVSTAYDAQGQVPEQPPPPSICGILPHDHHTRKTLSLLALDDQCRQYPVPGQHQLPGAAVLPTVVTTLLRRLHQLLGALRCRVPRQAFYFQAPSSQTPLHEPPEPQQPTVTGFKCYLMSNVPLADFFVVWKDGAALRYEPATGALHCDLGPGVRPAMRWRGQVGSIDANLSISSNRGALAGMVIPSHFRERVSAALKAHGRCLAQLRTGSGNSGGPEGGGVWVMPAE